MSTSATSAASSNADSRTRFRRVVAVVGGGPFADGPFYLPHELVDGVAHQHDRMAGRERFVEDLARAGLV